MEDIRPLPLPSSGNSGPLLPWQCHRERHFSSHCVQSRVGGFPSQNRTSNGLRGKFWPFWFHDFWIHCLSPSDIDLREMFVFGCGSYIWNCSSRIPHHFFLAAAHGTSALNLKFTRSFEIIDWLCSELSGSTKARRRLFLVETRVINIFKQKDSTEQPKPGEIDVRWRRKRARRKLSITGRFDIVYV